MRDFLKFMYSRKFTLVFAFFINLIILTLASVFNVLIYAVVVSIIVAILFLIVASNNLNNNAYKFYMSIIVFLLPIFGLYLYSFTKGKKGGRFQRIRRQKINYEFAELYEQKPAIVDNLSKINLNYAKISQSIKKSTTMPLYDKSSVTYLNNDKSYFEDLFKEIKSAKKYIFLHLASIQYGKVWEDLFAILKNKALNGVEVKILYDDSRCTKSFAEKDAFRKLVNHGIIAKPFNKIRLCDQFGSHYRLNTNLVLIDGNIARVGSISIEDDYLKLDKSLSVKHGNSVKLSGDAVWSYVIEFITDWKFFTGESLKVQNYKGSVNAKQKLTSYAQPFYVTPYLPENTGKNILLKAINSAQSSISIISPYLLLDSEMVNAFKIAVQSGIDVQIIISEKVNHKWMRALCLATISGLISDGIKIMLYSGEILTDKMVLIDSQVAILGGKCLDYRNMSSNFDMGIAIYNNQDFNLEAKKKFDNMALVSHLITLKDLKQRKLSEMILGAILRFFMPLL